MKPIRYPVRRKPSASRSQIAPEWLPPAGPSVSPGARLPPKKKRGRPEGEFQEQAVSLLRLMLPAPCVVWHVPNRHIPGLPAKVAAMLQRMGLLAGAHDLHMIGPGFFATIECKAGRGTLTDGQEDFAASMEACGWPWFEARDLGDVFGIAHTLSAAYGFECRPVTLTPGGFIWDRGPQ